MSPNETGDPLLEYWQSNPHTPAEYVVEKFKTHKWVFLGEYHRIKHDVDLVCSLVPLLHRETDVRRLALEFLCRDRTDEANELVTAETWSREEPIDFFRDMFPAWAYEEYLNIFHETWKSNREMAATRGRFQLVGLHPCPDYGVIHYGSDAIEAKREQEEQDRYDEIMAEALTSELIERNIKALVFTGVAHSTAKFAEYYYGTDKQLFRMGNLIYRDPSKDKMLFICMHAPFWDSGTSKDIYPFDGRLDRLMLRYGKAIGFDVVGTPFADLQHESPSPQSITAHSFGELYDGYIIFSTPIKEYMGVTCIEDWMDAEEEFEHFWRNLSNKKASERISGIPFVEFLKDRCSPRPDYGVEFSRRFKDLPELN